MQDTAVLSMLPLVATITSLSLSPYPTNAPAMAMALPTVLPSLQKLRVLNIPRALAAGVAATTSVLHALSALPLLEHLDASHAHLDTSAVATLVSSCPGCVTASSPPSMNVVSTSGVRYYECTRMMYMRVMPQSSFKAQSGLVHPNQNDPPFRLRIVKGWYEQVDSIYIAVEMNSVFKFGVARGRIIEFWIIKFRFTTFLYVSFRLRDALTTHSLIVSDVLFSRMTYMHGT
jgi:hypothetical protein